MADGNRNGSPLGNFRRFYRTKRRHCQPIVNLGCENIDFGEKSCGKQIGGTVIEILRRSRLHEGLCPGPARAMPPGHGGDAANLSRAWSAHLLCHRDAAMGRSDRGDRVACGRFLHRARRYRRGCADRRPVGLFLLLYDDRHDCGIWRPESADRSRPHGSGGRGGEGASRCAFASSSNARGSTTGDVVAVASSSASAPARIEARG